MTIERLFGWRDAFDEPVVLWAVVGVAVALVLALLIALILRGAKLLPRPLFAIWLRRWLSWLALAGCTIVPVLLGPACVMAAVCLLSLLCYREYARITGLFREKAISAVVVAGAGVLTFAVVDHFDRLFFACGALTVGMVAVVTLPQDRPKGYVQRVALGALGFALCVYSLGYLGLIANDSRYRLLLVWLLLAVEVSGLAGRGVARLFGGPRLLPNTSPNRTVAGASTALVVTIALAAGLGHVVFRGTEVGRLDRLIVLGVLVAVTAQLGPLVLSSIKRDVGVKETSAALPGHGGLLDHFDGLLLVPPAVFHYLSLYLGPLGGDTPARVFTGG